MRVNAWRSRDFTGLTDINVLDERDFSSGLTAMENGDYYVDVPASTIADEGDEVYFRVSVQHRAANSYWTVFSSSSSSIDIDSNNPPCEDGISNGRITRLEYDSSESVVFVFFTWTGDSSCGNPDNVLLSGWQDDWVLPISDTQILENEKFSRFNSNANGWYTWVYLSDMSGRSSGYDVYFSIRVSTTAVNTYTTWSNTLNTPTVSLSSRRRLTETVSMQLDSSKPNDSLAIAPGEDTNAAASRELQTSTSCSEATVGLDAGAASFRSGLGEVAMDFTDVPGANFVLGRVVLMDPVEISTVQVADNYDTGVQMDACTGTSQTPQARNAGVGSDGDSDGDGDGDSSSGSPVGAIVGALVAVVVLAGIGAAGYYVLVVRSTKPAPTPTGSA